MQLCVFMFVLMVKDRGWRGCWLDLYRLRTRRGVISWCVEFMSCKNMNADVLRFLIRIWLSLASLFALYSLLTLSLSSHFILPTYFSSFLDKFLLSGQLSIFLTFLFPIIIQYSNLLFFHFLPCLGELTGYF